MKQLFWAAVLVATAYFSVWAQPAFEGNVAPNTPLEEYFSAEDGNQNKSIIYIFYNGSQCYQCPETIALTEQIYNRFYNGKYALFVIDYENDDEYDFINAYNLNAPLSIVLVKIDQGQTLGYQKIVNPQNLINSSTDYTQYLTERIDNFLGYSL